MRKIILVLSLALFSFKIQATPIEMSCKEAPDCTALGYTKTASECPLGAVKCPWNTSLVYCVKGTEPCSIGSIYYQGDFCSSRKIDGKVALGVVIYMNPDGIGGQVMTASPIGEYIWSTEWKDIPSLKNYTTWESAKTDFDSCNNTDKIASMGNRTVYPAIWAIKGYYPTNARETATKWCLPAAGVLNNIYVNLSVINSGIEKLGGKKISETQPLYSSTEQGYDSFWLVEPTGIGHNNWASALETPGAYPATKYIEGSFYAILEF